MRQANCVLWSVESRPSHDAFPGVVAEAWPQHDRGQDRIGELNREEAIADATFTPATKRGISVSKTEKGKGTKLLVLIDGKGLPLGVSADSAQRSDICQIEPLLEERILDE